MTPGAQPTSIGVLLAAFTRHGQQPAIRHVRGEWTYRELLDQVYRMARVFQAQGLRRGQTIAILTGNLPETFVLRYAANVIGCCATILYQDLATPMLAEMVHACDADALVFDAAHGEQGLALVDAAPSIAAFTLGECGHGINIAALATTESSEPVPVEARAEDLAEIRLTGGSTGTPKGIPRTFRVPPFFAPPALKMWEDATQLLCTPIGHLGGTLAEIVLAAGGRVVLHQRFEADAVLAAIEQERVTFVWLQPILLHQLLDHPALASTDTSSLRSINLGGWASTPHRVAEALQRFGPIMVQGYGANEVGQITWLSREEHLNPELLTTVGRPVPTVEVSIRDADDKPVGTGVTGEIWVRGPSMMTGYYKQPEQTAAVLREGWFRSGDLGLLDADGYLTIVGRSKDVIIVTDVHVHPARVETLLMEHPDIQAAVVFGVTDAANDERVCAAIIPAPTRHVAKDEVVRWVSDHLGRAYAPDVVLLLDELPTTGSHKPDRIALRRMAAGQLPSTSTL